MGVAGGQRRDTGGTVHVDATERKRGIKDVQWQYISTLVPVVAAGVDSDPVEPAVLNLSAPIFKVHWEP